MRKKKRKVSPVSINRTPVSIERRVLLALHRPDPDRSNGRGKASCRGRSSIGKAPGCAKQSRGTGCRGKGKGIGPRLLDEDVVIARVRICLGMGYHACRAVLQLESVTYSTRALGRVRRWHSYWGVLVFRRFAGMQSCAPPDCDVLDDHRHSFVDLIFFNCDGLGFSGGARDATHNERPRGGGELNTTPPTPCQYQAPSKTKKK